MTTALELLSVVEKLPPKDQEFARSLAQTALKMRRGVTPKQQEWLDKLFQRAADPAPVVERPMVKVGELDGILALFDKAKQHLKHPGFVLQTPSEVAFRVTVATSAGRYPGTLNVVAYQENPNTGRRDFFGRVHKDGRFEEYSAAPDGLRAILNRFAMDPAGVAAEYGRLTGRCCFCHIRLCDERSTAVGYGPTCASKWELPWG